MGEHAQAVDHLTRCLYVSQPEESHLRKAHALLVSSLTATGRHEEAWQASLAGLASFPDDPELLFRHGMLAHALGRLEDAERAYRGALANREERHFSSVDPGIIGHKARHNLALTSADRGRHALAEVQWRHAVAEAPGFREGHRCLAECLIQQAKYRAAEVQIEHMLAQPAFHGDGQVLKSRLAEAQGDFASARCELETAVARMPDDRQPLQALCQFLFEHGELEDARQTLHRLVELCPRDGAAHHNLGLVYLRMGQSEHALPWLRQSLRLRPEGRLTWEQLAQTLDALGRPDEAAETRQQAQRIAAF
jgi:tetratricopeptide (TPR) repeat protein